MTKGLEAQRSFEAQLGASQTLSNHVVNDLMPNAARPGRNNLDGIVNPDGSLNIHMGIYGVHAPDVPPQVQSAMASTKGVDFTVPAQNAKSGQQPDFIMGPDGHITANPKARPHDGPLNIEVDTGKNDKTLADAIKHETRMQQKAAQEMIQLFKKAHPGEPVPQYLQDMLTQQPQLPNPSDSSGGAPQQPQDTSSQQQPQDTQPVQPQGSSAGSDSGAGGGGSGGGGGGAGGGGGGYGGDGGGGGGSSGGGGGGGYGGGGGAGSDGAAPAAANVGLSGGEQASANQIMDILTKQYGLSAAGAAGVVGNMTQENSLSTAQNSGGFGLCQWIGDRASALENFAAANHESPTSVQAQVGFMMHELSTQYPGLLQELKTTGDAKQAAYDFSSQYERPGDPQNQNREGYAVAALSGFHGNGTGHSNTAYG